MEHPLRRRSWRRATGIAAALLVAALVALTAKEANAVTTIIQVNPCKASCPAGYVCLWPLNDFPGTGVGFYSDEDNYATLSSTYNFIQDNSWSMYSHGNTYDVRFFANAGYSGRSFVLCKGDAISELPLNSWVKPGTGWRDTISSHDFAAIC